MDPNIEKELMIDLETMGVSPNGAIVAIGAAFFNMETGEVGSTFDIPVNLESSQELGMEIHASTVLWWFRQSTEAIALWNTDKALTLPRALEEFIGWYERNSFTKTGVWANAPTFDLDIMRTAFRLAGMGAPWHFKQERCVRTLVQMSRDVGFNPRAAEQKGVEHGALDDCLHQIEYCCAAWRAIRG